MTKQIETAILAGGCFWGMEALLRRYPGVLSTRVGYTGGNVPNATYLRHGTHAEALEVVFDPRQVSFRQILEFFFRRRLELPVGDLLSRRRAKASGYEHRGRRRRIRPLARQGRH
jgi:hypothetical protein